MIALSNLIMINTYVLHCLLCTVSNAVMWTKCMIPHRLKNVKQRSHGSNGDGFERREDNVFSRAAGTIGAGRTLWNPRKSNSPNSSPRKVGLYRLLEKLRQTKAKNDNINNILIVVNTPKLLFVFA